MISVYRSQKPTLEGYPQENNGTGTSSHKEGAGEQQHKSQPMRKEV